MPSSLTKVIPFVLQFSCRLPVSVCGTGASQRALAVFLASVNSSASTLSCPIHHPALCIAYFTTIQPHDLAVVFHPHGLTILLCPCLELCGSTGISTRCPSSTPFGLDLGPDLPWADEPSPGNLRLSTEAFLTPLSLLMPAFSLVCSPPPLSRVRLLPAYIAPLPNALLHFPSFGVMF